VTPNLISAVDLYLSYCFDTFSSPRVDELAQRLRTHPSALSRQFKRETGRRLSAVLKERQVEEAKRLLISTDLNLCAIAQRAGFGTVNTLFRLFRLHVGSPPESFRKAARK